MISVFTPTHNLSWLHECYQSLLAQTCTDFEWIIVPNGPARGYCRGYQDSRVRVINCPPEIDGKIGALKHFACSQARGDIVMELDHDDVLLPDAISEAEAAFSDSSVDFAYSNYVGHDFRVDYPMVYNGLYGWTHRPFSWHGRWMMESVSAKPLPTNVSRIWYAPNHFRAWRRSFYERIGGYNRALTVADDHELLCRTYIEGNMRHIDKPLYIYRVTGENSWLKHQTEIQDVQWANHNTFIDRMVEKWCRLEGGLKRISVGQNDAGFEAVKFGDGGISTWNMAESSVGHIRAKDVVQFIADPVELMNEAYRVLAHGGMLDITAPSTDGPGAWCNPRALSFWNSKSFRYYTDKAFAKTLPEYKGRFQAIQVRDLKISDVPYVHAQLVAVKHETPRIYGELLI